MKTFCKSAAPGTGASSCEHSKITAAWKDTLCWEEASAESKRSPQEASTVPPEQQHSHDTAAGHTLLMASWEYSPVAHLRSASRKGRKQVQYWSAPGGEGPPSPSAHQSLPGARILCQPTLQNQRCQGPRPAGCTTELITEAPGGNLRSPCTVSW